jgi:DNA-binding XRE family transcriptional regulator
VDKVLWRASDAQVTPQRVSLGSLIRHYREAAGLTQEGLAVRAGLSVRAVSDVERDRTQRPHQQTVLLLTRALGLGGAQAAELMAVSRGLTLAGSALAEAGMRSLSVGLAAPQQLPMAISHFVGRQADLALLSALTSLRDDVVLVAIIGGLPGVGKSSLAIHWAHAAKHLFPDGQMHIDLRGCDPHAGPLSPAEALRRVLKSFHVPSGQIPADLDGQVALYRTLLAGRRVLLILDNASDAEQVRLLLPSSPGCFALITSRQRLTSMVALHGARPISLGLLAEQESWKLLATLLSPDRLRAEPEAARELVARCGGLPLALSIMAARAAVRPAVPLAALAAELQHSRPAISAFHGGDAATDLRTAFAISWQRLSEPSRQLMRLLAKHAGGAADAALVARKAGIPEDAAASALRGLLEAHLLTDRGNGAFTLHPLLRAYAAEAGPARGRAGPG